MSNIKKIYFSSIIVILLYFILSYISCYVNFVGIFHIILPIVLIVFFILSIITFVLLLKNRNENILFLFINIFLSLTLLTFIIISLVNVITYDSSGTSFPWYTNILFYVMKFIWPIAALIVIIFANEIVNVVKKSKTL